MVWRLLLFVMTALALLPAMPQSPRKPVIGMLTVAIDANDELVDAFRKGLRQLGYIEGQNLVVEFRSAKGQTERLPSLAKELIDLKVDVIVTGSDAAIRAAKQATDQIPIVMAGSVSDPVATGLVESFNRPGGNLTGSFVRLDELNGKRLELLREVLPK